VITVERSFRLEAREGLGARPRPELIGPVLTHLHSTLQDTVRMGFLHSSRARGRVPAQLKAAADARYLGHSATGEAATLLHFAVPQFSAAAPELFRQQRIWEDGPEPDQTAFELLGSALVDVAARRKDSNRFDPGLLRRFAGYRRLFTRGQLTRIALPDTVSPEPARLDAEVTSAADELSAVTPASYRVRVVGRLDLMGASQGVLKLEVRPGVAVTGLWEGEAAMDSLRDFFNRDVVIEGKAVFRPSGSLLRVDVRAIAAASTADEYFRAVPSASAVVDAAKSARLGSRVSSPYERIFGRIPAEESDEDFLAAIDALT
jgi:hypothetical protein